MQIIASVKLSVSPLLCATVSDGFSRKNAAGFVRKELGSRLRLRHTPAPLFYATDSIEYSAGINKILNELDIPEEEEEEENEEDI